MQTIRSADLSTSYAVLWRWADGPLCAGELELNEHFLRLEGGYRDGRQVSLGIAYEDVEKAFIGRAVRDRIDARPTLIVDVRGEPRLLVTSAVGLGMIHEMAERLGTHIADGVAG